MLPRRQTPAMARHGVARTFQSSRPFLNLTVLENVTIAALLHTKHTAEAERRSPECIEMTGLKSSMHTEERQPAGGKKQASGSVPGAGSEA